MSKLVFGFLGIMFLIGIFFLLLFVFTHGYQYGVNDGIARVGMCEHIKDWPKYIADPKKSMEECKL